MQAARGQAPGFGIFGPGSVSRHPKHGHRQYQPVAGYPVWVGPLGVLPLPAHSLQGPESQFNPDPQPIPGYAQGLWRQVGQYQPGLGLILSPYHQQCSGTALCGPAESGAPAHPGVAWPRNQLSGRLPSSAQGLKAGVAFDPHPLTEERTFQHHFETTRPEPKKEKPRKAPTPKRTPEEQREARRLYERARNKQPERKEAARLHAKKIRKERKENGQCRHCSNGAITGQTRCESCRDRYNRSR